MDKKNNLENTLINTQENSLEIQKKNISNEVEDVLEQSQEFVLETNDHQEDTNTIENDLFSYEDQYENQELVSTSEFSLTTPQKTEAGVPALNNYRHVKKFENYLDEAMLEKIIRNSDIDLEKATNIIKAFPIIIVNRKDYNDLIEIFSNIKLISGGEKFLLFYGTSKTEPAYLQYLKENGYNSNIQEFVKQYFDSYKHIYVVDKKMKSTIINIQKKLVKEKEKTGKIAFEELEDVVVQQAKTTTEKLFDDLLNI